jgi:hypothetical protein
MKNKKESAVRGRQSAVAAIMQHVLCLSIFVAFQLNAYSSNCKKISSTSCNQNRGPWSVDCGLSEQQQPSDSNFTLIKSIPIEAKNIQTDRLGNIYVVSNTNQLYKYNSDGKLLSTLNYKYLGNITFVDATNPLEIYVFYKELNVVVFLDNNLAYRGEIHLADVNIGQAAAIARSFDNGIWVFDLADMQLKRMNKDGSNLQSSGNIRQYTSAGSTITYLYDNNDRVFVNDSTNGVFVFDVFATYVKTLPIKGCDEIKVIDKELFYYHTKQGLLKKYQLNAFTTTTYSLPESLVIKDMSIEKNRLYLLKADEVIIYGF